MESDTFTALFTKTACIPTGIEVNTNPSEPDSRAITNYKIITIGSYMVQRDHYPVYTETLHYCI